MHIVKCIRVNAEDLGWRLEKKSHGIERLKDFTGAYVYMEHVQNLIRESL